MKIKILAALFGIGIVTAGCVKTVNEQHAFGVPGVSDRIEGRYERSVDQVFNAAKAVLARNGSVSRESNLLGGTNTVRTVEGKVNQRNVWIRVEGIEPKPITAVTVQARSGGGSTDQALTHQLEKEIALELAR